MSDKDKKPPPWKAEVPEPENIVVYEDGQFRCELINYVAKGDRVKDIRVRGPIRFTRKEALKDGRDLYNTSLVAGYDPALFKVRERRKELETLKYKPEDLMKEDEGEQKKREEDKKRQQESNNRLMNEELNRKELLQQMAARTSSLNERHKPVGPKWIKPGPMVVLPEMIDHVSTGWLIHEKQDSQGKHRPWLYFNGGTGKYYRQKDDGEGYIQIGVPHAPQEYPINVRLGSASLLSGAGKKLDFAVLLPELNKTGFLLKQPLEFMDKPASLLVLCDGLRNAPAAAEFCAKRCHTVLLPKLSARSTEFEDFELVDILRDTVDSLDGLLLNSPACYAGCGFGIALQVGMRVACGSLGGVRCILSRPPDVLSNVGVSARVAASRAAVAATASWSSKCLAGGDANMLASEDERLRVESIGGQIFGPGVRLSARSAGPSTLQGISEERERLLLQVSRATGAFSTLGLRAEDLKGGAASIRSMYRKRSLQVHPDKVPANLRQHAVAVFAKLEAAATSVQDMLQADPKAAALLLQIDQAQDTGKLGADPAVAAQLLGVAEGSTSKVVKAAVKAKFHGPLGRLQNLSSSRTHVERGLNALEIAEAAVVRATQLWTPPEGDESVLVTRALGCKDLKAPVPLLTSSMTAECVNITPGAVVAVAMVSDGLHAIKEVQIAKLLSRHSPSRPRAAALRMALEGSAAAPGEAVSAIAAFYDFDSASSSSSSDSPAAKRAKVAKPDKVRISHVLLRWTGLKGEDEFSRPGFPPPTRTQADAEKELLDLLEQLLAGDAKTLGARFKAEVLKRSECGTACNVPYADVGWIDQGGAEPAIEAAAFSTPAGGLSDVCISSRGAHLMYRLG